MCVHVVRMCLSALTHRHTYTHQKHRQLLTDLSGGRGKVERTHTRVNGVALTLAQAFIYMTRTSELTQKTIEIMIIISH